MDNNTFEQLIKKLILIEEKAFSKTLGFDEDENMILERINTIYKEIFETFEIHGNFLDAIAINTKQDDLVKDQDIIKVIEWAFSYARRLLTIEQNILNPKTQEPSKAIKSDINIIKNFEAMLIKRFGSFQNLFSELNLTHPTLELIYNLQKDINKLKIDLETKSFEIFIKSQYYQFEPATKKELELLLRKLTKKYNIENVSMDIKQLKDNLPSLKTL